MLQFRIPYIIASFMTLLLSSYTFAVTFEELAQQENGSYQVIDTRTSDFYNGWPEEGATRGGHFPSAVNFPSAWLDILSDSEIRQLLANRDVEKETPIYLYGNKTESERLKTKLEEMRFSSVISIQQPFSQYTGELESLERFQHLVSAKWLKQLIENKQPRYQPKNRYKIIEVAWGEPTRYLVSHIPGALYLNTNRIETEENNWNRVSASELKNVLESLGVTHDTTTILYSSNTMAAARAAQLFLYAGVADVRLLDGGWNTWMKASYPTEALLQHSTRANFGKTVPAKPELVIDIPKAKQYLAYPNSHSLVSVRTWPEFIGETSGYSYIKPKGRIKGARWGHAGSDSYHMEDYHNPDGTMLGAALISQNWANWDINKEQHIAFFCGTGWRASEAFFYAYLMGWKNISVFDGGWYEWSMDSRNPVASGETRPDKS